MNDSQCRRYTPQEDSVLVRLWPTGASWLDVLAELPGRSYASVRRRAVRLGLRRPREAEGAPRRLESVAKDPGDPDWGVLPKEVLDFFGPRSGGQPI